MYASLGKFLLYIIIVIKLIVECTDKQALETKLQI